MFFMFSIVDLIYDPETGIISLNVTAAFYILHPHKVSSVVLFSFSDSYRAYAIRMQFVDVCYRLGRVVVPVAYIWTRAPASLCIHAERIETTIHAIDL